MKRFFREAAGDPAAGARRNLRGGADLSEAETKIRKVKDLL